MKKRLCLLTSLFVVCSSVGIHAQTMVVVGNDGTQHKFNTDYIQEIVLEEGDLPEENDYAFATLVPELYGRGNATLTFTTADASAILALDVYGSSEAQVLEVGEYVVGAADGLRISTDAQYTNFKKGDDAAVGVKSGKMTVSKNGTLYVIDIDVVLSDDAVVKGKYEGGVTGYDGLLTATSANYYENDYPQGQVYVKFYGDVRSMELAVMFVTDVTAATGRELPAGTYSYSADGGAGTFGPSSYMDLFRPSISNIKFAEGSVIEVSKDGDDYTISMTLKTSDNVEYAVTYTGVISASE